MVAGKEAQVMGFECYAAFFALSPKKQAEVALSVREDAQLNAVKQTEAEAVCGAKELEQQEKKRPRRS